MKHRIIGNIAGLVDDRDDMSDNNPVVIEYHYFEGSDSIMCITGISVYGAYPTLIRNLDPDILRRQVESAITNIEGDNVEFHTKTITIL